MNAKVSLKAVVDEIEMLTDQRHAYVNKRTGETVSISDEEIEAIDSEESLEDYPDWQQELIQLAREIRDSPDYVELPSKFDIHDYDIIERFCRSEEDPELRETLLGLIQGSGAFRRFKDAINEYNIVQAWYQFRRASYRQIAIESLESHEIPYNSDDN